MSNCPNAIEGRSNKGNEQANPQILSHATARNQEVSVMNASVAREIKDSPKEESK